ncbi:IF2 family translation initiation factor [Mycolicibacterium novocastrense]|uniref:IF2 family translation initiation factor n=1 Tax=Mycolicibacterium novocastrense TaxID=59813 RepID=A0AAW5SID3_MYCNV|nr:IF2 family translation initiation factor [Mycolicibacterium novocastrense]MCV7023136.1 IF2 family translation initiation factor [Mycolicibacterium novocastrense]GAT10770.1 NlpC/P60 family protein [Mycolicibacterium novocastrense]
MSLTAIPKAVLKFQYQVARVPLQLIDDRFVARMDDEAPARLFYERSLGMLDTAVGTALGDRELQKRGATLVERSDALRRAAELDAAADENVKQAGRELKVTREKALQDKQKAFEETEAEARQARTEAQQRKRAAVENAEKKIVEDKKRADEIAEQRKKNVETAKRREEEQIDAAERTAAKVASVKMADAQDKRVDAATTRAQAEKIEDLADAEKEKRQADR